MEFCVSKRSHKIYFSFTDAQNERIFWFAPQELEDNKDILSFFWKDMQGYLPVPTTLREAGSRMYLELNFPFKYRVTYGKTGICMLEEISVYKPMPSKLMDICNPNSERYDKDHPIVRSKHAEFFKRMDLETQTMIRQMNKVFGSVRINEKIL